MSVQFTLKTKYNPSSNRAWIAARGCGKNGKFGRQRNRQMTKGTRGGIVYLDFDPNYGRLLETLTLNDSDFLIQERAILTREASALSR